MEKTCENCKFYYAEVGSEGRWMICNNPIMKVADAYSDYKLVTDNGIGYSDSQYDSSLANLYVGKNFGCINFNDK